MSGNVKCPSCGSKLTHLQGATGKISICSHCGWARVEARSNMDPSELRVRVSRSLARAELRAS